MDMVTNVDKKRFNEQAAQRAASDPKSGLRSMRVGRFLIFLAIMFSPLIVIDWETYTWMQALIYFILWFFVWNFESVVSSLAYGIGFRVGAMRAHEFMETGKQNDDWVLSEELYTEETEH